MRTGWSDASADGTGARRGSTLVELVVWMAGSLLVLAVLAGAWNGLLRRFGGEEPRTGGADQALVAIRQLRADRHAGRLPADPGSAPQLAASPERIEWGPFLVDGEPVRHLWLREPSTGRWRWLRIAGTVGNERHQQRLEGFQVELYGTPVATRFHALTPWSDRCWLLLPPELAAAPRRLWWYAPPATGDPPPDPPGLPWPTSVTDALPGLVATVPPPFPYRTGPVLLETLPPDSRITLTGPGWSITIPAVP